MASDPQRDRDVAVRSMLVELAGRPQRSAARPGGFRVGVVTAVVLAVVVALSVVAIRAVQNRSAPPAGTPPVAVSPVPDPTTPAGVLLGRWTSADGATQHHVIRPDGLAIATVFTCRGEGDWLVHIPHDSDFGGTGGCGGASGGGGNKGVAGPVTVGIRTDPRMTWTLTVVGIPETYVTPQPVATPVDSAGTPVPFCTAAGLEVSFDAVAEPKEVTEVRGGQLVLRNTGSAACALAGHPGVLFVDGGAVLGHHTMDRVDQRSSEEHGEQAVIVQPGDRAYAQIDWYLPNYYGADADGACERQVVHTVRVDLANRLAGAAQTGTVDVPVGRVVACRNGRWGTDGKYGQLSASVFVDYAMEPGR